MSKAPCRPLLGKARVKSLVDLGTGTGRVLELFAPQAEQAIGIDSSREMLAIARSNLEKKALRHAQVRQGEIYALPFANGSADLVIIHQVLHYLDDPGRALLEAAPHSASRGRLLIVDFAPHELESLRSEHAHRRLGISAEQITGWFNRAGLTLQQHELLPPPWRKEQTGLTVSALAGRAQDNADAASPRETFRRPGVKGPMTDATPEAKKLTVSFEFFPPKPGEAEEAFWRTLKRLEPINPHFVSVTYGAGGTTRDRTLSTVKRIRNETNLKPAAHLTCVGAQQG